MFDGATLLITGGTGSFGNAVLRHFLTSNVNEIRIFSRDEKKQDDMRHELQSQLPEYAGKVKFHIGDVRNVQSVRDAMQGVDYVFHAAALKQVPSCEFFPLEAVQTNVLGTNNVLESAIANAEHNDGADIDELRVTTIYVEQGTTLKRSAARAKGRGARLSKPTCHVYVGVGN